MRPGSSTAPDGRLATLAALLSALLLALFAGPHPPALAQTQSDPEAGPGAVGSAERVVAERAMVVTANPHATRAGWEMLQAGGNAVDALIAAHFALNVVEPQSSGIGGGGFLLLYRAADGHLVTVDGREEAPAAATPDLFLQPDGTPEPFWPERITGGKAVGVPGLLAALEKASRQYGRLPLARTLAPAIRLAADGFAVSPRLAALLERQRDRLARFPATRALFFDGDAPLQAGAHLRQPALAATFRLIAEGGSDAFYQGPIAGDIVAAVREAPVRPGAMTLADLAGYAAPLRAPVQGTFAGFTVVGMGPPSSGGLTVIQILQLLDAARPLPREPRSAEAVHAFAQAVRLAYADRGRYIADADFVPVPVAGLLDRGYARRRAAALDWDAPLAPVEAGTPPGAEATARGRAPSGELPSTTHLAVMDADGNVATATSSIEQAFGSGMVVPGRGFFLNNELTDFAALPRDEQGRAVANRVEGGRRARATALDIPASRGGKRPRSSMAPTLVLKDGQPVLVVGSPGGSRIIQYVAWVLLLVLEYGWDVQDAIEFPHATHLGGRTVLEPAWEEPAILDRLRAWGHDLVIAEQNSGLHAIRIDPHTGRLHSGVDPRREGMALGE